MEATQRLRKSTRISQQSNARANKTTEGETSNDESTRDQTKQGEQHNTNSNLLKSWTTDKTVPNRTSVTRHNRDGDVIDLTALADAMESSGCSNNDRVKRLAMWDEDLIRYFFEVDLKFSPFEVAAGMELMDCM